MSNIKNKIKESSAVYNANDVELARLRRDVLRPDMEKLALFTKMLKTNALYKKAKITHK
jgi:hypothetical protein